jgi:hypothetical protein
MCICSSTAIRSSASIGWVRGIKVGHRVCFDRNFRCCERARQHFGRTAIRQHREWRTARSDQAIYRESEARLMRAKTSSFVTEFPLFTTAADEAALPIKPDATRNVCKASLGESLRRLDLMRESLDWQRARSMPAMLGTNAKGKPIPNKERSDLFKGTQSRFGSRPPLSRSSRKPAAMPAGIGEHLGSHDTNPGNFDAKGRVRSWRPSASALTANSPSTGPPEPRSRWANRGHGIDSLH